MNTHQSTLTIHSITSEAAQVLVQAAQKKARELGFAISICVLEATGRTKAFAAMDGAPPVSYETAEKKAKCALGFGMSTGQSWYDFIKDDPILMNGVTQLPDFILLGGGSPIQLNGSIVGAIGISGGHYKQDEACVQSALSALQNLK